MTSSEALDNMSSEMTLDTALRRAIREAPCTIRALARASGVSHAMLAAIVSGKERATARVALKVAEALDGMARLSATNAATVRRVAKGRTPREE